MYVKRKNIIAVIGLILAGYFFLLKPFVVNEFLLYKYGEDTVCTIVSLEPAVEGEPDFKYIYFVKGKMYNGIFSKDTRYNIRIGECYKLKYCSRAPSICKINLDYPCTK